MADGRRIDVSTLSPTDIALVVEHARDSACGPSEGAPPDGAGLFSDEGGADEGAEADAEADAEAGAEAGCARAAWPSTACGIVGLANRRGA